MIFIFHNFGDQLPGFRLENAGGYKRKLLTFGLQREEFSFCSYVRRPDCYFPASAFLIICSLAYMQYYHTAIFARRQAFVVFIVAHTFHLLELRGRYAAILQIILYGIGTVLGHLHVGFVRTDLVRMAYDGDVRSCVFLQNLGEVAQGSFRIVVQRRGVESKQNTGVNVTLTASRLLASFTISTCAPSILAAFRQPFLSIL